MVPSHMKARTRISRGARGHGKEMGVGVAGHGSKLHLLFTLSKAALLIDPDVFS